MKKQSIKPVLLLTIAAFIIFPSNRAFSADGKTEKPIVKMTSQSAPQKLNLQIVSKKAPQALKQTQLQIVEKRAAQSAQKIKVQAAGEAPPSSATRHQLTPQITEQIYPSPENQPQHTTVEKRALLPASQGQLNVTEKTSPNQFNLQVVTSRPAPAAQ